MKEPYENDGQIYWWDKLHQFTRPAFQPSLHSSQAKVVHADKGHFGAELFKRLYLQTTDVSRT